MNRFRFLHFTPYTIILLSFVFLLSCSSGDEIGVSRFSPQDETELLSNVEIVFTNDLAPRDTLGKWSEDQFLEFDPPVSGKFKWIDARTLFFSPDVPLEPIQEYKVNVSNNVLFNKDLKVDFPEQTFRTKSFEVTGADFFWSPKKETKTLNIQVNLKFNYAVAPDDLKKYLKAELNAEWGGKIDIKSEEPAELIALELSDLKMSEKPIEIELIVESGLMSVFGKEPLADSRSFDYDLPAFNRLSITGVSSGFDGSKGWIDIYTTQMADEKEVSKYISIDPAKKFTTSIYDNKIRLYIESGDTKAILLDIKKGLPGEYSGKLEFDFTQMISLTELRPSLNFINADQEYLLKSGQRNIELNIVNIKAIELEVFQIFDVNLVHFLEDNEYYHGSRYTRYYRTGTYGQKIYSKKIKLSSSDNWLQKTVINLDEINDTELKGIYLVQARSEESRWISDTRLVTLSDHGIIAKKGEDDFTIFVNTLSGTVPVEGATVKVISTNNVVLLEALTNNEGVCQFTSTKDKIGDFTPRAVTVQKGEDFNYIDLRENRIETSRFDVGGQIQPNPDYKIFIYGPRNLYRPGEGVSIAGIIRDARTETVFDLPLTLTVTTPNGKIYQKFRTVSGSQGEFEVNFDMPEFALTGQYIVDVETGSDDLLGTYYYSIEDFVPDKIRVSLSSASDYYFTGQTIKVSANAEFLYGAPAADMKYTADFQYRHSKIKSKTYPDLTFGINKNDPGIGNFYVEGKLDDQGYAGVLNKLPSFNNSSGLLSGFMFFSVFDLTGRPVNKVFPFKIYSYRHYSGINLPESYYSTDEEIVADIGVINTRDEPAEANVTVSLIRHEWKSVLKKTYSGTYYYDSEKRAETIFTEKILVDGLEQKKFRVTKSGSYELRVYHPEGKGYSSQSFWAYGWGSGSYSSFEVDREGRINITADEEVYQPGDDARILFTTPFDGKMLVTTERNGLFTHQYVDVVNKSAEINLPVNEDYLPNVFVSATLFKPHTGESKTPLLVAHGYKSLKVEKESYKLNLDIDVAEKLKPNSSVKVKLSADKNSRVKYSLAVVDEGILQIKNYKTPDPYNFMYAKQPLRLESYDLYDQLAEEIVSMSSSVGGDALAAELQKRANPIKSKRFKLVSLWSGIAETNSNGEATFNIYIPQFNGELRVMALAFDGKAFGSAETSVKVAEDVIIEPEFPRVVTIGDTIRGIVSVINTTGSNLDLRPSISVSGAAKLVDYDESSLSVDSEGIGKVEYSITSAENVGAADIKFAISGDRTSNYDINFAVRPASPLVKKYESGRIAAGEEFKYEPESVFLEGTTSGKVTIAKFPSLKFADQLDNLVRYPHGCLEQTVSKVFPLLYFAELAKLISPDLFLQKNPVYYVNEGIRKINTMQLPDGSFSYWQGGQFVNEWSVVYATHFLMEAKKAGFEVDEQMLRNAVSYIKRVALNRDLSEYRHYSNGRKQITKIARKEALYALYVLALTGEADIATMNYYFSRQHLLSGDTRYFLAGAFALSGNLDTYKELLPENFEIEQSEKLSGGSFDSPIRANALKLNILVDTAPNDSRIPMIVKYLSDNMKKAYSTQERAFAFIGLGKAAKKNIDSDVSVKISGNNLSEEYSGNPLTFNYDPGATGQLSFKAQGEGEVYYFISYEGVPLTPETKSVNENMSVKRELFDYKTGIPVQGNSVEQGNLFICKITLRSNGIPAENIVITDMIPSGFEIENPRLTSGSRLAEQGNMIVDYEDIRDDRLILFTNLKSSGASTYTYLLRAVNKGEMVYPRISAEAMYDNEFRSYNGYQKIIVR
ncbi:MAG: membrane protein [Melioribacteraceae bacterium]|nr:MAG: membrane protein [Melioribacteraceae bacterium]